jgi:hypothetical protein
MIKILSPKSTLFSFFPSDPRGAMRARAQVRLIGMMIEADMDTVAYLSPLACSVARTAFEASYMTTEEAEMRIEKTKELLMKFDEQKRNWRDQNQRPLQQIRARTVSRDGIVIRDAGYGVRILLSPVAVTNKPIEWSIYKDFPTNEEDEDEVYCNDKENSGRGAVEHAGRSMEKTKELLMKFDQQKKTWKDQSQRPLQQLRTMASGKDGGIGRIPSPRTKMELTKSKDVPADAVEVAEGVIYDDKVNIERGVVAGSTNLSISYCGNAGNDMPASLSSIEGESKKQSTENQESAPLQSHAQGTGGGEYDENFDDFPAILDAHPESTDSMESTGSSLSTQYVRKMKGVVETQPLGGAKYYIMVNTKRGQAKVVHEAMPAGGREGFTITMEEKGYEIVEYDFLPEGEDGLEQDDSFGSHYCNTKINEIRETQPLGGAKYYILADTKKGQAKIVHEAMPRKGREGFTLAMQEQGYEVYEHDLPCPRDKNESNDEENQPTNVEDEPTNRENELTDGDNETTNETTNVVYGSPRRGYDSFLERIDDALNKVLDVAERIDDALTGNGCNVQSDRSFDIDDNRTVEERSRRRKSLPGRAVDRAPCRAVESRSSASRPSRRGKGEDSRSMSRLERRRPLAFGRK